LLIDPGVRVIIHSDAQRTLNWELVDGGLVTGPLRRNRQGAGDPKAVDAFRDMMIQAAGQEWGS
jgi:hypothetical protein